LNKKINNFGSTYKTNLEVVIVYILKNIYGGKKYLWGVTFIKLNDKNLHSSIYNT